MRKSRGLSALLAAVVAMATCLFAATPAHAHEAVDMTRTGSITVEMSYEGQPVGGGSLVLYRVGDVVENDGDFTFGLSDEFAGSGLALDDVEAAGLAEELASYAERSGVAGQAFAVASDGTMSATGLELGLYLVTQGEPAEGFDDITPFLVSVPAHAAEADIYVYDVDATPKMDVMRPAPEPPVEETPEPGAPSSEDLPESGESAWLVPVLAVVGVGLVLVGASFVLRARSRSNRGA